MIHIKVPVGRVGVIIGRKGATKKLIEEQTNISLHIDSESGSVEILSPDPLNEMRAGDIIKAIGRGFSPENAFRLLDDDLVFSLIDLSKILSTPNDIIRIKGRIIGKDGKTREMIESLCGVKVSVYGKTVGVIGVPEWAQIARKAIGMLIEGAPHGAVYAYLEKQRREQYLHAGFKGITIVK
jgi:ribosomal RNA assembly protein